MTAPNVHLPLMSTTLKCVVIPQQPKFCSFINVKLKGETPFLWSYLFLTLNKWRTRLVENRSERKKTKAKLYGV